MTEQALLRSADDASLVVSYQAMLDDGLACGGKARGLARLAVAGVPVPEFFVVRNVELVGGQALPSAWQFGQLLDHARIEDGLATAIEHEARRLGGASDASVAVRSSSQSEDAQHSSFAGQ